MVLAAAERCGGAPDITYAVSFVSRFMEAPTTKHLAAVKHVLQCIAGTLAYRCIFHRGDSLELVGFGDSDMAGDLDDGKSTLGVLFFLPHQKQRVVAIFSYEAEYIAGSIVACQGTWLAHLTGELLNRNAGAAKIFIDNKYAICLGKNPVLHDRSKHITTSPATSRKEVVVEFIDPVRNRRTS